jgi:hypothetical protein
MECHSFLYEEDDEKWVRQDICNTCWRDNVHLEKIARIKSQNYISWKSKIGCLPHKKPQPSNAIENILELFHTALSNDNESSQAEAFLLALLLKRKKKFIERKEFKHSTGQIYVLYEDAATQEIFTVLKVGLDRLEADNIQQIQQQIKMKLQDYSATV